MRSDFNPGRLDRRILIEQPVRTADDFGEGEVSWVTVAEVWAEVQDQLLFNNGEASNIDVRQRKLPTRLRIRFREDIDTTMRATLRGRVMQIISIAELGRRDGLELMAENFSTAGD